MEQASYLFKVWFKPKTGRFSEISHLDAVSLPRMEHAISRKEIVSKASTKTVDQAEGHFLVELVLNPIYAPFLAIDAPSLCLQILREALRLRGYSSDDDPVTIELIESEESVAE